MGRKRNRLKMEKMFKRIGPKNRSKNFLSKKNRSKNRFENCPKKN